MKHEEKYCPKCKVAFECKVGSILLCQCSTVRLNHAELEFIQSKYDDCLCADCMKALKAEFHHKKVQNKMKRILGVMDNHSKS